LSSSLADTTRSAAPTIRTLLAKAFAFDVLCTISRKFHGSRMLSVIIITKNEQNRIRACLESVKFADEIVVVDSGSQDQTVQICLSYTPHVFVTDWPGFGPQKQRALSKATGDWILSIDADEIVSEESKNEILQAISNPSIRGYYLPRLSFFCGHPVRHCGWYPDYIIRLFQKQYGRFSEDIVHERIVLDGAASKLQYPLIHYSYDNLEQVVDKLNYYSSLGAQKLLQDKRHSRGGLLTAIIRALAAFSRTFILKAGFLDGRIGFVIAVTSAETAFYKYLKLAFLRSDDTSAL
jgi:glycosyltransferase involved in cell wall biosynthesis